MLKPYPKLNPALPPLQPPSGGCVLKQHYDKTGDKSLVQPPSGGCVLKQNLINGVLALIAGSHLRVAVC